MIKKVKQILPTYHPNFLSMEPQTTIYFLTLSACLMDPENPEKSLVDPESCA